MSLVVVLVNICLFNSDISIKRAVSVNFFNGCNGEMNNRFLRPNFLVFFRFESSIFKNDLFVLSDYVFWVALGLMQFSEFWRLVVFSIFNLAVFELISFYHSTLPYVFLIIQSFAVSRFHCFSVKMISYLLNICGIVLWLLNDTLIVF